MRLSKIKLAGFKSFVDPTTISLPSNLLGVVGPNGCGKSNVIDAVRWVMGESSAKHLRGDSMADVIFNGSSTRKPVGTATIELVFDNSDGTIGGQYAGFSDISVRRVVSRDGTSSYYLNNTRCRRKDITSIFLGTGLGPRSYSIIEQGMISRIVDSKPEEMRNYLEEAAGISKYKERRRETENRIRHTRENLERLNDLRDEVAKQIRRLQRQASLAEKYKTYKQEQKRVAAELLTLQLGEMEHRIDAEERAIAEKENRLQEAVAAQRAVEKDIESCREQLSENSERFNAVQESYYKLGAEIARLEQTIRHSRELRDRQKRDRDEAEETLQELIAVRERDQQQLQDLEQTLGTLAPQLEEARRRQSESAAALADTEARLHDWRIDRDAFQAEASGAENRTGLEKTRIEHQEETLSRLLREREKIRVERAALSIEDLREELTGLEAMESVQRGELAGLEASLHDVVDQIQALRARDRSLTGELDSARRRQQELGGRLASVEALQQAALGQGSSDVSAWLEGSGFGDQPRLAQQMQVEAGWERAVETVLGGYLEAVCVPGIDAVEAVLSALPDSSVSFVASANLRSSGGQTGSRLSDRLRNPDCAGSLLDNILAAESLEHALSVRATLGSGQSVVTRDGVWMGPDWLRVNRDDDPRSGILAREQALRDMRRDAQRLESSVQDLDEQHEAVRQNLKDLEEKRDGEQEAVNREHRAHVDLMAQLDARRTRLSQMSDRIEVLEQDAGQIEENIDAADTELRAARSRLEQLMDDRAALEDRRAELDRRREALRQHLESARDTAAEDRDTAQELAIQVEARRSTRDSACESLQRMGEQNTRLESRRAELERQLLEGEAPMLENQASLNALLESRVSVEADMREARRGMEGVDTRLRELEQRRSASELDVDERRAALQAASMAAQEVRVRRDTVAERFAETGFDLAELRDALPADATTAVWIERAEKVDGKIGRLGPINLAAIDEFREQSERRDYLDAQNADLTEALETLEKAIRKIDRETRTRFKETFDKVNDGFKSLFPRLFGGGHAYLELGDSDLLTAGVTIMARPPGKRNSTIHLLSGGEKALTAVALVFAIFQLNPAPFCMLDEVDAPLDDANVGRFCDIVREMSEHVQFVFITHNKSTIELANQLMGVTMHEAGCSRLVAVDVDEAVQLAAV